MTVRYTGTLPFIFLLLPYCIGIGAGLGFDATNTVNYLMIAAVLAAAFILINFLYKPLRIYKANWLGGVLLFVFLFIVGVLNVGVNKGMNHKDHFSFKKADELLIKIIEEPLVKNGTVRFTAEVKQLFNKTNPLHTSGKILIYIKDTTANITYGDVLLIKAKYNEVSAPLNPAEFNYKAFLANKNIYHQAYLYKGQYVKFKEGQGNPLIAYALKLRQRLVTKLQTNITNQEAAAIASTLILGYKAQLSDDILQAYSKTGTTHVLSVSGAHVGLVYIVLLFLLSFLTRFKHGRIIQAIIIIISIWGYALLTGFSPPVCRAAVMLSLIVSGKTYSRYINTLNILAFSAFVMLLFNPLLITDAGFQLSYLAVAGLILLQPVIYKKIIIKNKWADKLWLVCSASIAAQLAALPLSTYYFHQVPVYFLISNLFILLPSALIMYGGILYLLLPTNFILTKWLGYVLEKLILFTNHGLTVIEHAPLSVIDKIWLTRFEYILLYAIVIMLFIYLRKTGKRLIYLFTGLVITFIVLVGIKNYTLSHSSEMVFASIRNGNCIVFRNGKQAVVLTDLSADDKAFKYSVQPYLDSCDVNRLTLIGMDKDVSNTFFTKHGDSIKFINQSIYLINKDTGRYPDADIYYFMANHKNVLNNTLKATTFITGNTVSNSFSEKLVVKAKTQNINCKILRRNKAFVLASNRKK
ncbi:ComEC family competence protein [Mucilaginibacter limnophilus]|uniref:ComEC family competence protein n=1 Tax=Mucilaginibacter limnophilus TaxID=1932778 RepID=A0A437MTS7_9SPHI|nr:ComEC/Rec2 family competence protein [Mucilaginibacter limnophilus]RVU01049.1 ComEC family competence protein [Mucilaginibacter limnophilus]